jgi:hypothetical protein
MLNTHLLTGRIRAKAVADYGFLGWVTLKQLVMPQCCDKLVEQAEQLNFDAIFNEETTSKSKKPSPRARAAAKAGQEADDVLLCIYNLLKEMLIISDAHKWGLGRGATFLKTPPGCLEQVSFTPRRAPFSNTGAGTPSGLLPLPDCSGERVCRPQAPALLGSYCFARPFWAENIRPRRGGHHSGALQG